MLKKIAGALLFTLSPLLSLEIDINQIGYDLESSKRAVIRVTETEIPTSFSVISPNSGEVQFSNSLTKMPTPNGWSGSYWIADFSEFKTEGNYKLKVKTSRTSAQSYQFKIGKNLLFTETAELIVDYFKGMRCTNDDRAVSFEGDRPGTVDLDGGWFDAAGDPGKHLSHLSYANYFNPQQQPLPIWTMLKSYEKNEDLFSSIQSKLFAEARYGAEYLIKSLDDAGYFYTSVFDGWGFGDTRTICEWTGLEGSRVDTYKAGMREGAGLSIAALALASRFDVTPSESTNWLNAAKKAYNHLKQQNSSYINDGVENIIDDYTALIAAAELYRADGGSEYQNDVLSRANSIIGKQHSEGWFYSDKNRTRLFFHAAEEGLVLIALAEALEITNDPSVKSALEKARNWYVNSTRDGANPYDYVPLQYTPLSGSTNLLLDASAKASSENHYSYAPASNAIDGNVETAWSSENGWDYNDTLDTLTVKLSSAQTLSKISVNWGYEYAEHFTVEVSATGEQWEALGEYLWRSGGVEQISFDQKEIQYIRVICQRWRWIEEWGSWDSPMYYTINEITAYGPPETDQVKSYFMPHDNETGYWWQGENARLGSMSAALVWAEMALKGSVDITDTVGVIAQSQLDWILGKNTEGVCMMTARGSKGYPTYKAQYGIDNVDGGICNGITGDEQGGFSPYFFSDDQSSASWRWIEQWLPHSSWFLMGLSSLQEAKDRDATPVVDQNSVVSKSSISLKQSGKSLIIDAKLTGSNSRVELYDFRGRQILKRSIDSKGSSMIQLNSFSNGIYLMRVMSDNSIVKSAKLQIR